MIVNPDNKYPDPDKVYSGSQNKKIIEMGQSLIPFIPPFLRVNAETWNEIPNAVQFREFLGWIWAHITLFRVCALTGWVTGLYYMHEQFDAALLFVIFSAFIGVFANLGDSAHQNEMSAYSVFNKGTQE